MKEFEILRKMATALVTLVAVMIMFLDAQGVPESIFNTFLGYAFMGILALTGVALSIELGKAAMKKILLS